MRGTFFVWPGRWVHIGVLADCLASWGPGFYSCRSKVWRAPTTTDLLRVKQNPQLGLTPRFGMTKEKASV